MHRFFRNLLIVSLLAGSGATAQNAADKKAPGVKLTTPSSELGIRLRERAREKFWANEYENIRITKKDLSEAVELARAYYLNHQKPDGNFIYSRDIFTGRISDDDNQVRQAGAIWGLCSLNRDRPTNDTAQAAIKGLDFFLRNSHPLSFGRIAPVYPKADAVKTGTVALMVLSLVELWRGEELYLTRLGRGFCDSWVRNYLDFLGAMELDNGSWGSKYHLVENYRDTQSSAYYDGEALLAYCKAARYMDHKELIPKITRIAPLLAQKYTIDAWENDLDSEDSKGFFQWGCMAFAECVEMGWDKDGVLGDAALAMCWWQIHIREILRRRGNTAYAVEGLVAAYRIAKHRKDTAAMESLRQVIDRLLVKQLACQIAGPLMEHNERLLGKTLRPECLGGITNGKGSSQIRIDVVQHQVHAILMAIDAFYPAETPKKATP